MGIAVNDNQLETMDLKTLLSGFEQCVETMFNSRALMFKIVSVIDGKNLLRIKDNYTKRQLQILSDKGISRPWELKTKDVMKALYEYFSWSQYVKYGFLSGKLSNEMATRLSEDALILLNKKRKYLDNLMPELKMIRGIISRQQVQAIYDAFSATIPKPPREGVAENLTNILDSKDVKLVNVIDDYDEKVIAITDTEIENKALRKHITFLESENRRLHEENFKLIDEVKRLKRA